jgi:hypothetical protein
VVRERSAKPLCVGSIPTRASNSFPASFFFSIFSPIRRLPIHLAERPVVLLVGLEREAGATGPRKCAEVNPQALKCSAVKLLSKPRKH